ncbi:MAG: hypothetical protein NZ529_04435 [Cytophagaceae bacterium]|nr:hypothetical protein [Cytophagaceae bacterium]MDW8456022.1 hypothetical protein [Cytophagaceae bacterium]
MKRLQVAPLYITLSIALIFCSKEKNNVLDKKISCDTANVSYINQVKPILERKCFNCHKVSDCASRGGNVCFETYQQVKALTDAGFIVPNIEHKAGYSPMPQGASKLPDCEIALIRSWVNQGAKNN